jgi:hypothetical protein
MKFSQLAILGVLNFISIMCDYTAIVSYAQMQKVAQFSLRGLEFRLPFYLLMKLTLTPILTHFFGMWILNRFFVFKVVFKYFLIQVLGIIIYEFTVWDRNSGSSSLYSVSASVLGGFRLIFPSIYTMNFSGATNAEPYIFQWLPHFFMVFTSICNALIPVLTKSFLIQSSHQLKLTQYQKQKTKLKDGQLNAQFLDQDMLLNPKIVTMTSMVYKRFQYLYSNLKARKVALTTKMYKPFREGYLHSAIYHKVFSKQEEDENDPVSQAFAQYKKEVVMD